MSVSASDPTQKRILPLAGVAVVLAIGAILWAGRGRLSENGLFPDIDYAAYHLAGLQVRLGLAHESLYSPASIERARIASIAGADPAALNEVNRRVPAAMRIPAGTTSYIYPPLLAVLVVPLTLLPFQLANLIWRILLLFAVGAGLRGIHIILVRRCGTSPIAASAVVVACAATWPMLYGFRMGQASLLVFAATALAAWAATEGRFGWAGFALGVGALLKLTPVVLLVLFLAVPLRRALWSALATIVGGTALTWPVVSPVDFVRFFIAMIPHAHQAAAPGNNQSVLGLFVHLFMSPAARRDMSSGAIVAPRTLEIAAQLASVLILLAALAACLRASRRRQHLHPGSPALAVDIGVLSIATAAVSPLALTHLYAPGLIAYAVVLAGLPAVTSAADSGQRARWVIAGALQFLWLFPVSILSWGFGQWPPQRLLLNSTIIAGLWTCWLAWRSHTPFRLPTTAQAKPTVG